MTAQIYRFTPPNSAPVEPLADVRAAIRERDARLAADAFLARQSGDFTEEEMDAMRNYIAPQRAHYPGVFAVLAGGWVIGVGLMFYAATKWGAVWLDWAAGWIIQ